MTLLAMMFFSLLLSAQQKMPQMADTFRQEGKIYVVIAVIAVIFISLLVFLVAIDRKVSRLERKVRKNESDQSTSI